MSVYTVESSGGYKEIGEKYYIKGPHWGAFGEYDGWYLDPESRFDKEEAERICKWMNMAYEKGRQSLQNELKKLIGIKE